jgi:hypothetical protein
MPIELPSVTAHLRWHRRVAGDRPSQWLRGHIVASLRLGAGAGESEGLPGGPESAHT